MCIHVYIRVVVYLRVDSELVNLKVGGGKILGCVYEQCAYTRTERHMLHIHVYVKGNPHPVQFSGSV